MGTDVSPRWRWNPWLTVAVGCLVVMSPWVAALILGPQSIVLNSIVAGAVLAIAVGVAGLVSLLLAMFRQN
jgi:hypothetical protein